MSNTLLKFDLIVKLMTKGYTKAQATGLIESFSEVLSEELLEGNRIRLPSVGTITPKVTPSRMQNVAGEMTQTSESLNLSIKTSRTLRNKWKETKSTEAKKSRSIRDWSENI